MKVAFLVFAHNEPRQLRRLLNRLQAPWATAIVHLDAKVDARIFGDLSEVATCVSDLDRTRVFWGGFSQTRSILNTLRFTLARCPSADRICVLSGADYPARSSDELLARFEAMGSAAMIRIDRALNPSGPGVHDSFLRDCHLADNLLMNEMFSRAPKIASRVQSLANRIRRMPPDGLTFFHGASWWCMPRESVRTILNVAGQSPSLIDWFRWTKCSDEIFFQTMAKKLIPTADLPQDLTAGATPPDCLHGIHYIDWRQGGDHPKTLTLDDLPAIEASPALFIRKVSSQQSGPLLDHLDRRAGL